MRETRLGHQGILCLPHPAKRGHADRIDATSNQDRRDERFPIFSNDGRNKSKFCHNFYELEARGVYTILLGHANLGASLRQQESRDTMRRVELHSSLLVSRPPLSPGGGEGAGLRHAWRVRRFRRPSRSRGALAPRQTIPLFRQRLRTPELGPAGDGIRDETAMGLRTGNTLLGRVMLDSNLDEAVSDGSPENSPFTAEAATLPHPR